MSNISVRPKTLQNQVHVEGFKGFSYFFSLRNNAPPKPKPPNKSFFREKIQIPDVCVCDRSLATREWLPVFQSRVFGGWGWLSNCSSQDQQRHRGKGLSAGGDKRETIVSDKLKRPQIKWIVYFLPEVLIRNLQGTPRHAQCWERAHRMVCRSLWVRYNELMPRSWQ